MISLLTNIVRAVNAIDAGEVTPVSETGNYLYVFNTSNRELGNLIYTKFNKDSLMPIASYQVRYGTALSVGQCIYSPLSRSKLPYIANQSLPGEFTLPPDPSIIPCSYCN